MGGHERGVLGGAFALLDSLVSASDGLGLSALSRASGLPKSSTYRIAEQLTRVGAVRRADRRYHLGPRMARLGGGQRVDPIFAFLTELSWLGGLEGLDRLRIARSPSGRESHAFRPPCVALPDSWTRTEWHRLSTAIPATRVEKTTARTDLPRPGCVAAPIRLPNGVCVGAVSVALLVPLPPGYLSDVVVAAARRLSHACGPAVR